MAVQQFSSSVRGETHLQAWCKGVMPSSSVAFTRSFEMSSNHGAMLTKKDESVACILTRCIVVYFFGASARIHLFLCLSSASMQAVKRVYVDNQHIVMSQTL